MRYSIPVRTSGFLMFLFLILTGAFALEGWGAEQNQTPAQNESMHYPFRKGQWNAGFQIGAGQGFEILGSREEHDLALAYFHYGKMLTNPHGSGWYAGGLEIRGELFAGLQYDPDCRYVTGLTPIFRYNFTGGDRLIPFLEGGAGVTLTNIGEPDLGSTFEFSPQGGTGFSYFLRDSLALTASFRFIHLSNAGMELPNTGVNTFMLLFGLSWFPRSD
ncbi:MAG: acyloxyacyl hydrolase [Desulfovibrionales bacterium]